MDTTHKIDPIVLACSLSLLCSSGCKAENPSAPTHSFAHEDCVMKCAKEHIAEARRVAANKPRIRVTYTPPDKYESTAIILPGNPAYDAINLVLYCQVYYEHHPDKCPEGRTLNDCESFCPERLVKEASWKRPGCLVL